MNKTKNAVIPYLGFFQFFILGSNYLLKIFFITIQFLHQSTML